VPHIIITSGSPAEIPITLTLCITVPYYRGDINTATRLKAAVSLSLRMRMARSFFSLRV